MANAQVPDGNQYYIPHDSPWPIRGSVALFAVMLGAISYLNDWAGGWAFIPGAVLLAYMFFGWFAVVIGESEHGTYNMQVDRSFRMGMMWFIFSEVMFFAAFFGALFYARVLSVPWLGGEGVKVFTNFLLWPHFEAGWPTNGPAHVGGIDGVFRTIPAFGIPALNTAILLTSGLTITIAHHALRAGQRGKLKLFLALTFLLGFTFVGLQAHEYGEAYKDLGLRLSHRHLRLDVLHAHRLPRPARDHRRDHADGDLAARAARPLHPQAPLRLRGGGLVLALRRRGVARPVHLRVLAVAHRRQGRPRHPPLGVGRLRRPASGCGSRNPSRQATNSSTNSAIDRLMRTVRARASCAESSSPPPRERWNSPEPRLTRIPARHSATKTQMTDRMHESVPPARAPGRAGAWAPAGARRCWPAWYSCAWGSGSGAAARSARRSGPTSPAAPRCWSTSAAAPPPTSPSTSGCAPTAASIPRHQFLLDNRSYRGQPGYEVLTPLVRAGATALLVDRGWVPFTGSRRSLPEVAVADTGRA